MENASAESEEEGEIVEYEPLPRPLQEGCAKVQGMPDVESDNEETDDIAAELKKPKIASDVRNKYNVWASELQESQLMDELSGWDAGLKSMVIDKSRNVESYYYYSPGEDHKGRNGILKRRHGEEVDMRSRINQMPKETLVDGKSHSRILADLRVTAEDSVESVAQDIVTKLCEEKEDLVLQVVNVLGQRKAIDVFQATQKIEEDGGILVMNGSRRRTPGGVFLHLIKQDTEISAHQRDQIFAESRQFESRKKKIQNQCGEKRLPSLFGEKKCMTNITEQTCDQHSENDQETLVKNPPPSPATDGEQLDDRCPPGAPGPPSYHDIFDLQLDTEMDL